MGNIINPEGITTLNYAEKSAIFCSKLDTLEAHNAHMALGLADEYFELLRAIEAKDDVNIIEELGDICWFTAVFAKENNIDFYNCMFIAANRISDDNAAQTEGIESIINLSKAGIAKYTKTFTEEFKTDAVTKVLDFVFANLRKVHEPTPIITVLYKNYMKLSNRHGKKFNADNAQTRDVAAEREILASS